MRLSGNTKVRHVLYYKVNILKLTNSKQTNKQAKMISWRFPDLNIALITDELRKKPQFSIVPWMERARPPSSMRFQLVSTCAALTVELPEPFDAFSRKK